MIDRVEEAVNHGDRLGDGESFKEVHHLSAFVVQALAGEFFYVGRFFQ